MRIHEGNRREPAVQVVSMYTDQVPHNDLSRGLAAKYGFKIYPTVRQALTLGGDQLAVDSAVLIAGASFSTGGWLLPAVLCA